MSHPYTNQLIHETSPYLLQHAHNPVNWHPWGPEALRLAREQGKPIFLSIGYAACHWCHVMEHESFEDEAVARILNEHFVPVKVDREERPDLDEIYMNATILYTHGHGGWPMSVWLTPDGQPFFAGTYFPPQDAFGRPGFTTVLQHLAQLWKESGADLAADADRVVKILESMHTPAPAGILPREAVSEAARRLAGLFDARHGGVSSGPNKFPPSMAMELLLREHRKAGERYPLSMVEKTLEAMARGGIYDQLGGGIHRYSTDPQWLVPHFEKMLYDQALVSSIYLDGFCATGRQEFADTARGIFDYVLRNLQSEEGGIYSTEDADSEGLEGKFYIWTLDEVENILDDDARLFAAYYDVSERGNWNHPGDAHVPAGPKNILRILRPLEEVARELRINPVEAERRLAEERQKLFAEREKRVHPGLDDKILAAWNGLMIASLAQGSTVLDEPKYLDAAVRAAEFVLGRMQQSGRLLRSYRKGRAHLMAYLDDYAFLIDALLWLYEVTGRLRWLDEAERLTATAITYFWDDAAGGFFFTASDHEQLIVRSKLATDSAIPSGNSVMIANLLRLSVLLGRADLREKAGKILAVFGGNAAQSPFAHERFLAGLEAWHEGFQEIALVGDLRSPLAKQLLRVFYESYLPNKVVALLDPSWPEARQLAERLPLLAGKQPVGGKPTAFVCRNYACQQPTSDPATLRKQLGLHSGTH
jgi:uncharacterized protein YyaL (SSP411 family)